MKVKEVAHEKHISQRQLHLRTEIALSSIKRIFRDPYTEIKLGTLARIAEVLDVPTSQLIEDENEQ